MQETDSDNLKTDQYIIELEQLLIIFYLKHRWKIKLVILVPILNLVCNLSIVIFSAFQLFNNNSQDEWYIYCIAIIFAMVQYIVINIRLSSISHFSLMEHTIKVLKEKNHTGAEGETIELASSFCAKALTEDDENERMHAGLIVESGFFRLLLPFIFALLSILIILSHSIFIKLALLASYLFPTLIFINMSKQISDIGGLFAKISVLNWASNFQKENRD